MITDAIINPVKSINDNAMLAPYLILCHCVEVNGPVDAFDRLTLFLASDQIHISNHEIAFRTRVIREISTFEMSSHTHPANHPSAAAILLHNKSLKETTVTFIL